MKAAERDLTSHDDEEKFEALNNFKVKFIQVYIFKSIVSSVSVILILVLNYLWTINMGSNNISAMNHLNVLSRINSKVKFINMFTLESVQLHDTIQLEGKPQQIKIKVITLK
jgi:hypothetical protein